MQFKFDNFTTTVNISNELPKISIDDALFVCDENTKQYADSLRGNNPVCVLKSGEENKNWESVQKILRSSFEAGLGRCGSLIGVGGGVIGDLTAFAASVYMRGCRFRLVATTLLAMADASIGGKTGFDLFDIKNLCGTFYPAETVYMPLDTLKTLPRREYKSGLAELIKTMILTGQEGQMGQMVFSPNDHPPLSLLSLYITKAVNYKAKIVTSDFKETKGKRALLNLGHTFGHALEAAAGLGNITHGEAVAYGIAKACNLGVSLNITPQKRAEKIISLLKTLGYDTASSHPLAKTEIFKNALLSDKKKNKESILFIVPNKTSAQVVSLKAEEVFKIFC